MNPTSPVPPIEALVFDVGGVLVAHENRRIHERLATRCRFGTSIPDIAARLRNRKWDRGQDRVDALHAELVRDLGYDSDGDAFLDDWCCHFTPDSSMLTFVEALARDNRVLLFSNTNEVHWNYLERHCPIGGFERYLSHEIGRSKPDVEAFALVAEGHRAGGLAVLRRSRRKRRGCAPGWVSRRGLSRPILARRLSGRIGRSPPAVSRSADGGFDQQRQLEIALFQFEDLVV